MHETKQNFAYRVLFTQHMTFHSDTYDLLRKLSSIEDGGDELNQHDQILIILDQVQAHVKSSYHTN